MPSNAKPLIGRLNSTTRAALEAAAGLCLARTHYDVEIEHFLLKTLDIVDADVARILRHFEVDTAQLTADLTRSLDRFKRGNSGTPDFSPKLMVMLEEAWTLGSLHFGAAEIRSGFTLLALATKDDLARIKTNSREFQKIDSNTLWKDFAAIVSGSREEPAQPQAAGHPGATPSAAGAVGGKTPNLDQFTINLTENAKRGKIDPVLGRDSEIRQIVDILMRRRQNNPILTGEAGVGKTAVVEGFAQRVANGDVPPALRNVVVRSLDLALLQAGAGIKGEFENRLKGLIEEVKASPVPIILFIDEAHTMIGAGGQAGQNDAANLLKPALARGELRTIAATTWSEYKKYFEKDAALARRFQVVKVEEPGEDQCSVMLRGVVASLETHHNVRILDEAVKSAVRLSSRYIAGRQLPDKAVSVLDTACARLSLGQNATPESVEDLIRRIEDLTVQTRILRREAAVGADHEGELARIAEQRAEFEARLATLKERWEKERALVEKMRGLRKALEEADEAGKAATSEEVKSLRTQLDADTLALEELQGEEPLIGVCVDAQIVGEVISGWTGIPVGKMVRDEIALVLELESHLGQRVIGQSHALAAISQRISTSRASLDDPGKPVGVFLLVGPSGVGKTETALALADLLYGGERNLITINMSEFQEAHTVSTLKGSPPGYVGYGEGGVLTEAVRRRPYSVVLLDEVEKAHPDVLELFYRVFDKGMMEDGEGREIDFKNTIILLTSNACTDVLMSLCSDPADLPDAKDLVAEIKPALDQIFKPAFLGRMVVIPYYPIRDEALKRIITLKLGKIQRRLLETHRLEIDYDNALVETIADRCTEVESGARNVDNILTNTLLPELSTMLLKNMASGEELGRIRVSVGEDGAFSYSTSYSASSYSGSPAAIAGTVN
jgi:type VI secretion system protein VasG